MSNYIEYVKIEDGKIIEFVPRPDWRDGEGNPVSDAILISEGGYYPVDFETNKPVIDSFYQELMPAHNFEGWEILADRVVVNYTILEQTLDEKKEELKRVIKQKFEERQDQGYLSTILNVKIACRREDLDNMKNLLTYMQTNNITTTQFRVLDNSFVEITQEQLSAMIDELVQFGISLYNKKWVKEQEIESAATMDELKVIDINGAFNG
jgi:hypothetical protein